MVKRAPADDVGDDGLRTGEPQRSAAGLAGVRHGLRPVLDQGGVVGGAKPPRLVNQQRGFDCPGCAWPESDKPHLVEFCENGAKAVAEESTVRRVGADFFAAHPVSQLATRSDHWLGQQGRLAEPMLREAGTDHYRPVTWDDAFGIVADELAAMDSPDQAVFYTSGRTSNEAAFLYQLFARRLGTNNLPDCSNMCHESSGAALSQTLGIGKGTPLADLFLQIRLAGDLAFFQAVNRLLVEADDIDHDFIASHTKGFAEAAEGWAALDPVDVRDATGLARQEIEAFVAEVRRAHSVIVCWAMGLTQHRHAVPTIREIVNFLLLRGNIGRPGAGACPVRGHSNVQGDRTMGIWEDPPAWFLDALASEFSFSPPRTSGYDTVGAIRAMRDGMVRVFVAMGGNFAAATPDTAVSAAALQKVPLTVHVSTKLNRSHALAGRRSLILPCLGRTEIDVQAGGEQFVTVEDSMSIVHGSRGTLAPASPALRSEVAIVCDLARQVLGPDDPTPWEQFSADYAAVRDRISRVVPGFDEFEAKVAVPGGFVLPHPPRDERRFPTPDGKAAFSVNPLSVLRVPPGRLLLQTVRSHDQFNTTIYGMDDRYRGVRGGRRVVFVNPEDLAD